MKYTEEYYKDTYMNVESFSKKVGERINIGTTVIKDYILSNISIGLASNSEVRQYIDNVYNKDQLKYYNAAINSSTVTHIIMAQGSLEEEIYSRKLLGILLVAEFDSSLRNNVIKILRKHHPVVYNSVKKFDKRKLRDRYSQMDEITRNKESKLDSTIYFYLTIHRSPEWVDEGFIIAIMDDIMNFEFNSLITSDIDKELEKYRMRIDTIKNSIIDKHGKINTYKEFINTYKKYNERKFVILQNLFKINKIDMDYLLNDIVNLDLDKIVLSYIKSGSKEWEPEVILDSIIIQILINVYKKAKYIYFKNNKETLSFKVNSLEKHMNNTINQNNEFKERINFLEQDKEKFEDMLHNATNKLSKKYNSEINTLQSRIKELEESLEEERKSRRELNALREYIFEVDNKYIPKNSDDTLEKYIKNKKIIIIGGTKEWRRKFREKYPDIRTLNGFNENFDVSILNNIEYTFFFTRYMNHSTYYKAMNFIRINQMPFGYIGKTNIDLVEEEIIDELEKYRAKRLN